MCDQATKINTDALMAFVYTLGFDVTVLNIGERPLAYCGNSELTIKPTFINGYSYDVVSDRIVKYLETFECVRHVFVWPALKPTAQNYGKSSSFQGLILGAVSSCGVDVHITKDAA